MNLTEITNAIAEVKIDWSEELAPNDKSSWPTDGCSWPHVIGRTPFGNALITWPSQDAWRLAPGFTVKEFPWTSGPGFLFDTLQQAKDHVRTEFQSRLQQCFKLESTVAPKEVKPVGDSPKQRLNFYPAQITWITVQSASDHTLCVLGINALEDVVITGMVQDATDFFHVQPNTWYPQRTVHHTLLEAQRGAERAFAERTMKSDSFSNSEALIEAVTLNLQSSSQVSESRVLSSTELSACVRYLMRRDTERLNKTSLAKTITQHLFPKR